MFIAWFNHQMMVVTEETEGVRFNDTTMWVKKQIVKQYHWYYVVAPAIETFEDY